MSLTRKFLSAMGIEAEKIEQIIDGHSETVTALQEEIDKAKAEAAQYKTEADKLGAVQKELDDYREQVEAEAKKREGKDYDALKKEFDDYKAEVKRKETFAEKEKFLNELMNDMHFSDEGKRIILKYHGADCVNIDDSGKFTNAKEVRKDLEGDFSKYIETTVISGVQVTTPPANTTGTARTREEIMQIKDDNERQQAISENHTLFGY